jgi:hypothetical protein
VAPDSIVVRAIETPPFSTIVSTEGLGGHREGPIASVIQPIKMPAAAVAMPFRVASFEMTRRRSWAPHSPGLTPPSC